MEKTVQYTQLLCYIGLIFPSKLSLWATLLADYITNKVNVVVIIQRQMTKNTYMPLFSRKLSTHPFTKTWKNVGMYKFFCGRLAPMCVLQRWTQKGVIQPSLHFQLSVLIWHSCITFVQFFEEIVNLRERGEEFHRVEPWHTWKVKL